MSRLLLVVIFIQTLFQTANILSELIQSNQAVLKLKLVEKR